MKDNLKYLIRKIQSIRVDLYSGASIAIIDEELRAIEKDINKLINSVNE